MGLFLIRFGVECLKGIGVEVELFDGEFGLFEIGLAGFQQIRALFKFFDQICERGLSVLHGFNDGFKSLERVFK